MTQLYGHIGDPNLKLLVLYKQNLNNLKIIILNSWIYMNYNNNNNSNNKNNDDDDDTNKVCIYLIEKIWRSDIYRRPLYTTTNTTITTTTTAAA